MTIANTSIANTFTDFVNKINEVAYVVNQNIGGAVSNTYLQTLIGGYVANTDLYATFVTNSDFQTTIGGYVANTDLYATFATNTAIQGYLTDLYANAVNDFANVNITLTAGDGLSGGGDLSANRTFAVDFANTTEAEAGVITTKAINPATFMSVLNSATGATTIRPVNIHPENGSEYGFGHLFLRCIPMQTTDFYASRDVQIAMDLAFANVVFTDTANTTLDTIEYDAWEKGFRLSPSTTYYWRMRYNANTASANSDWSKPTSFTTRSVINYWSEYDGTSDGIVYSISANSTQSSSNFSFDSYKLADNYFLITTYENNASDQLIWLLHTTGTTISVVDCATTDSIMNDSRIVVLDANNFILGGGDTVDVIKGNIQANTITFGPKTRITANSPKSDYSSLFKLTDTRVGLGFADDGFLDYFIVHTFDVSGNTITPVQNTHMSRAATNMSQIEYFPDHNFAVWNSTDSYYRFSGLAWNNDGTIGDIMNLNRNTNHNPLATTYNRKNFARIGSDGLAWVNYQGYIYWEPNFMGEGLRPLSYVKLDTVDSFDTASAYSPFMEVVKHDDQHAIVIYQDRPNYVNKIAVVDYSNTYNMTTVSTNTIWTAPYGSAHKYPTKYVSLSANKGVVYYSANSRPQLTMIDFDAQMNPIVGNTIPMTDGYFMGQNYTGDIHAIDANTIVINYNDNNTPNFGKYRTLNVGDTYFSNLGYANTGTTRTYRTRTFKASSNTFVSWYVDSSKMKNYIFGVDSSGTITRVANTVFDVQLSSTPASFDSMFGQIDANTYFSITQFNSSSTQIHCIVLGLDLTDRHNNQYCQHASLSKFDHSAI